MLTTTIIGNKIILRTDDPSIHNFLEAEIEEGGFNFWSKKWQVQKVKKPIYEIGRGVKTQLKDGTFKYVLGLGWAAYLMNVFAKYLSIDDYKDLQSVIVAENYRDTPFNNLRDYQNSDALFLLKFKIGLFTVNTSYGKTELISTLANYFHGLGKKVLLVTPGSKARDELVKRCKIRFNLEASGKIGDQLTCIITSGLLNRKDFKDEKLLKGIEKELTNYDVVLVDEVEYTINPSGKFLYDRLIGAKVFYGFSGTSDKYSAQALTFNNGLSEDIIRNKDLISYFGPTLIYRMPLNIKVDSISIRTESLNHLKFTESDFSQDQNIYMTVMNKIWTSDEVCKDIVKIAEHYPKMFIPINNLTEIINTWIDKYFLKKFRILLVCGEGYIYYDKKGNRSSLTLEEACDYIKNDLVDVIPSTSAGYRALDFPNLENILLIQGNRAGVTLQAVGRVARGTHMNIISLEPAFPAKIPIYSKGAEGRDEMIKGYYKYCEINDITVNIGSL